MPTNTSGLSSVLLSGQSGLPGRRMADGFLEPRHYANKRNRKYVFDDFSCRPQFSKSDGNGAATGATGDINVIATNRGVYEWHVKGAGQTILVPSFDVTNGKGLDWAQDNTNTEGHEVAFSPNIVTANGDRGHLAFVIGTDDDFFVRCKYLSSDWSGVNPIALGFRKVQAYDTALANYTDYAVVKAVGSGTTGSLRLETNLNGGTAATTNTTQTKADDVAATFEVRVKKSGSVKFLIDGAAPTVDVSDFVFDSGDIVIPFSFFLHGADVANNLWYQEFECGYITQKSVN